MPARSLPSSSTAGTRSGSGAPAPAPSRINGFATGGPATVAPVLDRRVRIKDLRLMLARPRVVEQSFPRAADRIGKRPICEWEGRCAVHADADWRCPPRVQIDACGASNMRHHTVEHLPIAFVAVESFVQEFAQEPAALGCAERVRIAEIPHVSPV